jgi:ssDNA-binding Zn-finger/Zn-ribbon topoisomerase 1
MTPHEPYTGVVYLCIKTRAQFVDEDDVDNCGLLQNKKRLRQLTLPQCNHQRNTREKGTRAPQTPWHQMPKEEEREKKKTKKNVVMCASKQNDVEAVAVSLVCCRKIV